MKKTTTKSKTNFTLSEQKKIYTRHYNNIKALTKFINSKTVTPILLVNLKKARTGLINCNKLLASPLLVEITRKQQKEGLKAPLTKGLRTFAAKSVGVAGLKKKSGTLKKGYKYEKGGKIVKVAPKTTTKKTK